MKNYFSVLTYALALSATPCLAQSEQYDSQPPVRAEDPAYLEDSQSVDHYTEDQVVQNNTRTPASTAAANQQNVNAKHPIFLENEEKKEKSKVQTQRQPSATNAGRTETTGQAQPVGTQLSFFEISPALGSISIKDKSAFSTGANLSFHLTPNSPVYFEPSFLVSFLSGDNNQNATLFHADAGFRFDWVIGDSPVVPFVKAAIGPTLSSNNNTVVNGETISDSYFNAFLGGGLKVLINPRIGARFDTGVTFQGTNPGLYVLGAATLPL